MIVGGLAAIGYGAERLTNDADCVVRHDRVDFDRLGHALESMEISTWMTDAGGLDVLANIPAGDGRRVVYEELAARANLIQGDGFVIRAAALDDIIAAKEWANRAKDRAALPELYELRDARSRTDA